jgi:hypothetical protein
MDEESRLALALLERLVDAFERLAEGADRIADGIAKLGNPPGPRPGQLRD